LTADFFAALFADFVAGLFAETFFVAGLFTVFFAVFLGVAFAFAGAVFARAGLETAFRFFGLGAAGMSGIGMAAASLAAGM
jgi:hypothetical protein